MNIYDKLGISKEKIKRKSKTIAKQKQFKSKTIAE